MNHRRRLWVAVLAIAVGAFGWAQLCSTPTPGGQFPLVAGGAKLSLLDRPLVVGAATVVAGAGDLVLESPRLRLSIGARADSAESELRRGALLDLVPQDFRTDQLQQVRVVLAVGNQVLPLRTTTIVPEVVEGRVRVVLVQHAASFEVTTRLWLDPQAPRVHLESVVENQGRRTSEPVRLGDRVEWPGRATFAPRLGLVTQATRAEVPWVGKEGSRVSYGLAFDQGPQEVEFLFDRVGPVGVLAFAAGEPLASGAQLVYRRSLIVSSGGLGAVAKAAFGIQGKSVGSVRGNVQPIPRRGVVVAQHPDGKPLVQVQTSPQGTFELTLPVGRYTIASLTAGGVDQEDVEVTAGSVRNVPLLAPLAGSLRYTIRDASGSASPGRVTLRGIAPPPNPDFGEWERAEGMRNVVYSASGEGELELAPGRYRVIVTRGFEYSIFEKEIQVGATSGASVRALLKHELDTPGWVAGDFHVHAAPSFDSTIPLADRVISLSAEGVEFAVATDHNHVTDYAPALDETGLVDRLGATPGVEVTTERWGHFIAFPYGVGQPGPPFEGVDPGSIFDAIRAQSPNSVIQINHPRMPPIAYFASLKVDASLSAAGEVAAAEREHDRGGGRAAGGQTGFESRAGAALLEPAPGFSFDFDTIEVVNGFELADEPAMERNLADWFALLNLGYRYTAVGNSDSHSLVHQWVGFPRTYVRVETEDLSRLEGIEVAHALLYGRAQISNGIFLEVRAAAGAEPGDELTLADGRLDLRILARAAPWVSISHAEIWVNGVQRANSSLARALRAPNRLQWVTGLSIASDAWLVVIARGAEDLGERYPGAKGKPFAISNPLFLDVDGDGVFRAPLAGVDPAAHPASGVFQRRKHPR
jgi:hypothetical protein